MANDITYPRASLYARRDRGGEYWVDFSAWKPVQGARRGPLYIDENNTKTRDLRIAASAYSRLEEVMQSRWRKHIGSEAEGGDRESSKLGPNPLVRDVATRLHFHAKKGMVADSSLRREVRALKVFLQNSEPDLRLSALTPPRAAGLRQAKDARPGDGPCHGAQGVVRDFRACQDGRGARTPRYQSGPGRPVEASRTTERAGFSPARRGGSTARRSPQVR